MICNVFPYLNISVCNCVFSNHNHIPKQPSCETGCRPQKSRVKKRCEIQGGSQEMAVMVENFLLIMTIQMNLSFQSSAPNTPELSLLKLLSITAISWSPPWISHLFHPGLLGPHPFFTAWVFWYRHHFILHCILQSQPVLTINSLLVFFSSLQKGGRDQELNSVDISIMACSDAIF